MVTLHTHTTFYMKVVFSSQNKNPKTSIWKLDLCDFPWYSNSFDSGPYPTQWKSTGCLISPTLLNKLSGLVQAPLLVEMLTSLGSSWLKLGSKDGDTGRLLALCLACHGRSIEQRFPKPWASSVSSVLTSLGLAPSLALSCCSNLSPQLHTCKLTPHPYSRLKTHWFTKLDIGAVITLVCLVGPLSGMSMSCVS